MHSIKKLLLPLSFCFLTFSITSCSDEGNDDISPAPAQIISSSTLTGDWEMVSLDYAGTSTNVSGGQATTVGFSAIGRDFTYQITFSDNPKTYTAGGGYTVDLTSIYAGQSSTQAVTIPDAPSSGTWSLVGNILTITDSNTQESNSTEILSGSQNSFSYDFAGLNGKSLGGANVNFTSGQVGYSRL